MVSSSDDVLEAIREQRRAYEPFTPLTDDEVKRAVQAIQNAIGEWGSDRLHAQWARHVLENTERNVLATVGAGDRPPAPSDAAILADRDMARAQIANITAMLEAVEPEVPHALNGIKLAIEDRVRLLVERAIRPPPRAAPPE